MEIVKQIVSALLASTSFSVLFGSPKNTVFFSGLTGAFGWSLYLIGINQFNNIIAGTFFGAIGVGLLGEFLAKYMKKPATLYITTGIIPLVPGAGIYYTMFGIISNDFNIALEKGTETFFVSTAIAVGIIVSSVIFKAINKVQNNTG